MNVVRICFQASYKDSSGQTRHLSPVLSEPIFDKSTWWWRGLHIPPPHPSHPPNNPCSSIWFWDGAGEEVAPTGF